MNQKQAARREIAIVQFAQQITAAWSKIADSYLEAGRLLTEARASLEAGDWVKFVEEHLPFSVRTAQRLMAIHADELIGSNATPASRPADWSTAYEITRLPPAVRAKAVAEGAITPESTRNDVRQIALTAKRVERQRPADGGGKVEDLASLIAAGRTFPTIVADPPWQYETWSDKGATRSAQQHYETMTIEQIMDLPVEKLASPDSILHLWVIGGLLDAALDVMHAWEFRYIKIGFVWLKVDGEDRPKMGNGHWTRDECEVCLIGTRGSPKRMDAGVRQLIQAPVKEHSAKPEEFRERVDRLTDGPVIELFGRTPRHGWTVWGNQIKWVAP